MRRRSAKLSVVIQAGGESRRMGRNKALVPFLGQPLIQRVIERVRPIADELLITANPPDELAFLGLPVQADILPGRGALGGLYTAFVAARHPLVAVVACDMAFVSLALLAAERAAVVRLEADGAVPRSRFGLEVFHGVYRREPCLAAVEKGLAGGLQRADCWFGWVRMIHFTLEETAVHNPSGEAFININNPEELRQAEEYASTRANRPGAAETI